MKKIIIDSAKKPLVFLIGFLFLTFIYLFFRNSGLYPLVLDELYYHKFANIHEISKSHYPNYLYYLIYSTTQFCGDAFWSCAQFLNSVFYVAAAIPIYSLSRKIYPRNIAAYITCISIIAPFNYFTAFFMIEALYIFVFWVLLYYLSCINNESPLGSYFVTGIIFGCLALVKVNALLIAPAIVSYIFYVNKKYHSNHIQGVHIKWGVFVLTALAVKFLTSWLIAKDNGLSVFGSVYQDNITRIYQVLIQKFSINHALVPQGVNSDLGLKFSIFTLIQSTATNISSILFYFSIPLVTIIYILKNKSIFNGFSSDQKNIYVLAILFLVNLVVVTSFFNWYLVSNGQDNVYPMRRYYEFAFPLLLMIACPGFLPVQNRAKGPRYLLSFILSLVLVVLLFFCGLPFWLEDWFKTSKIAYYVFASLALVNLIAWGYDARLGSKIYLFILFPIVALVMNIGIYRALEGSRKEPSANDRVAIFTKNYLGAKGLSELIVAGENVGPFNLFYLGSLNTPLIKLSPGEEFDPRVMPAGKNWALIFNGNKLSKFAQEANHMDYIIFGDAILYGGHGTMRLNLRRSELSNGILKNFSGFHEAESWGAWSDGGVLQFNFIKPLPRKFNITIIGRAPSNLVHSEAIFRLGDFKKTLNFTENLSEIHFQVDNFEKRSNLDFIVTKTVNPKILGIGQDDRNLGIGLQEIIIDW